MVTISQQDFIASIRDALRYIAYYHSVDFIQAMHQAYEKEESIAAKDAIAQILINSRMCAEGQRPICQDTGIINIFLKVGMNIHWNTRNSIEEMVNQAVHDVYTDKDHPLRASIVNDPDGARNNTGDNTPAVIHTELVPGDHIDITVAAKGGGSENKARFAVLNPRDDVVSWVLEQVSDMGAGWCPPGILGIGIGGTAEKALLMAKESLMQPIDIQALRQRGANNRAEELRLEIYDKVNALGIGAQGLGGLTTVLDVKVMDYPTHAASKPIAIIPNCAASRHIHFRLDGTGPVNLSPPVLSDWPEISRTGETPSTRIDLNTIDKQQISQWQAGDCLLVSGKILTARDAAHKRIVDLLTKGEALPKGLNFNNRFVYYVGPVNPAAGEVIGPAGPTTASRMDEFTEPMLNTGLLGMIGKAERGDATIESIKQHQSVYLIATGGAAYLISKAIKGMRIVAFPELGMEAVYEFEVEDMPVTVAVDSQGHSIHKSGPQEWRVRIADIPR
ncbi:MAG: fumarate hydratase [Gammaproteobacteria bacterium]|nr:fumarate hydratase [Gammaproteobacteria bacterium]